MLWSPLPSQHLQTLDKLSPLKNYLPNKLTPSMEKGGKGQRNCVSIIYIFSIWFFLFWSVFQYVIYHFPYVSNCFHLVLSVFHLTFSNVPLGQVHFIQHMLVRCSTRVESLPQPFQTWNYFENFLFLLKDSLIFILYSVASLKLLSEQIKPVSYFSFGQFKETFP